MTAYCNPGDRLINKVIKAKVKGKYVIWAMQQTVDESGKLPTPSRAQSVRWAAEAMKLIPQRMIVRSFVACRVTLPEDYYADERREFGLDELVHMSYVRALESVIDDDELRAQLEAMSDADDDEWLQDERTTHVAEDHEEEEQWDAQAEEEELHTEEQELHTEGVTGAAGSRGRSSRARSGRAAAAEEEDWTELEVGQDAIVESHPATAGIVGLDVCVLAAAFPQTALQTPGAIGWRVTVTGKCGSVANKSLQVNVSGLMGSLERPGAHPPDPAGGRRRGKGERGGRRERGG